MKKIYCNNISVSVNSDGYEVVPESVECDYSEEWTRDEDDPIKDYVENMIENETGESLEGAGYSWTGNIVSLDFCDLAYTGAAHILYDKNGDPVSIYYVNEVDND